MKENRLDMFGQKGQLLTLGVGGLGDFDFGPGIAGSKAWIAAFVVLLVLAWLARWTIRPARRTARTKQRDGAPETDRAKQAVEPSRAGRTLAKQTRRA